MTRRRSRDDNAGFRKVKPRKQTNEPLAEKPAAPATKPPQSQVLLALAREAGIGVWATPEADPYMTVSVDGHHEHHRLGTRASRDWLSCLFYRREGKAPSAQALQDTLGVLRGEALWGDGQRHSVHVRHATRGGAIYVDIGDPTWRAVEVDAAGWRIVADPPIRFRRPRGMLPLPDPERGGSLDVLRPLLNVGEDSWTLIAGWLIGCMAPSGPYPVLGLHGEQGAAKSSAARLLRDLLDPNIAPLRSEPRDERDLVIAASNGRIVALDNVSSLSPSLSDALCRLATGGGFATRELYSDAEEVIFNAVRPAILTGIAEVATRGDLLDRSILVTLEPIPERERLTEADLESRWADVAPVAFGALLDAASTALRRQGEVHLDHLPRMADHARWVMAAESALGWKPATYVKVYADARAAAVETALAASPLTEPIRTLAKNGWDGTATELLAALEDRVAEPVTRSRAWPRSARGLSGSLRRLAPDLRSEGVEVEWGRTAGVGSRRVIAIRKALDSSDAFVARSQGDEGDARDAESPAHSEGGCASHLDTPVAGCRYCRALVQEVAAR